MSGSFVLIETVTEPATHSAGAAVSSSSDSPPLGCSAVVRGCHLNFSGKGKAKANIEAAVKAAEGKTVKLRPSRTDEQSVLQLVPVELDEFRRIVPGLTHVSDLLNLDFTVKSLKHFKKLNADEIKGYCAFCAHRHVVSIVRAQGAMAEGAMAEFSLLELAIGAIAALSRGIISDEDIAAWEYFRIAVVAAETACNNVRSKAQRDVLLSILSLVKSGKASTKTGGKEGYFRQLEWMQEVVSSLLVEGAGAQEPHDQGKVCSYPIDSHAVALVTAGGVLDYAQTVYLTNSFFKLPPDTAVITSDSGNSGFKQCCSSLVREDMCNSHRMRW